MATPFSFARRTLTSTADDNHRTEIMVSSTDGVIARWSASPVTAGQYGLLDSDGDTVGMPPPIGSAGWHYFSSTLLANGDVAILSTGKALSRYDSQGQLLDQSSALVSQTGTAGRVTELASGNLLATYASGSQLFGQFFNSALDPVGSPFLLLNGPNYFAHVVALADGGFVVDGGTVGGSWIIQAFNASGVAVGPQINDNHIGFADVEALPGGGYVVALPQVGAPGVLGQVFNSDGTARTAQFQISPGEFRAAQLVILSDSLFAAVVVGADGDLRAQLVHIDGLPLGGLQLLDEASLNFSESDGSLPWDAQAIDSDSFVTVQVDNGQVAVDFFSFNTDVVRVGTAAADTLDGVGEDRILAGFGGDDTYVVDSAGDEIVEIGGEGTDRVRTSVSFVLPAGQEIEILQTTNNIGTAPLALTGNEFSQYIFGNYGANLIDGGGGGDIMLGFLGDDIYVVRHAADQVRENAGEGFDRINGTISYALGAGQEVEMLAFANNIGTLPLQLTGNELSQYIFGNYGNNVLRGGGGGDVLIGFQGFDDYIVTDSRDDVREGIFEGDLDRVLASVSYQLHPGVYVEALLAAAPGGTEAIDLTGNALRQDITGNNGDNRLTSGGGGGLMIGLGGNDTYYVSDALDVVLEASGQGFDRVRSSIDFAIGVLAEIEMITTNDNFGTAAIDLTGNGFSQHIFGNAGNNALNGLGGADTLIGLAGDDFFYAQPDDQIREVAGEGFDRVFAEGSTPGNPFRLNPGAAVEMITTLDNLGTHAVDIIGNELAQYVYGNDGANQLGGGAGRDVLNGFDGDDRFLFDTALNTAFTPNFNALADTANVDRIDGFGFDDKIVLSGALFGLTPGALPGRRVQHRHDRDRCRRSHPLGRRVRSAALRSGRNRRPGRPADRFSVEPVQSRRKLHRRRLNSATFCLDDWKARAYSRSIMFAWWRSGSDHRAAALLAALLLEALLALALVLGLGMTMPAGRDEILKLVNLAPAPPAPPPAIPERRSRRRPEGEPSPPNLRARPTEIVAPKPLIPPPLPTLPAAPIAGPGSAPSAGAADVPGPGFGAGGVGNGFGGGGDGDGDGGGGFTPPRRIRGSLGDSDYPAGLGEAGIGGTVSVQFSVETDGRVGRCFVTRSSGHAELDDLTCQLIERRYRFRPSLGPDGRPVRARVAENHTWETIDDPPPPEARRERRRFIR